MKNIILVINISFLFLWASCNNTSHKKHEIRNEKDTLSKSINENIKVKNGSVELYIDIKSKNTNNPLVLFLHGGPGDVPFGLFPFEVYVGKDLEQNYIMAYLHQRGNGKSMLVPDSEQTIENHVNDVETVINKLLEKFNKDKIYLIGHSWGGLLGFEYLLKDESKVAKFINIGTPVNLLESTKESYDLTMKWAKENQADAVTELKKIGEPPYNNIEDLLTKSKWSAPVNGGIDAHISMEKITSEKEIQEEWRQNTLNVAKAMLNELNEVDLYPVVGELKTPTLFIAGKNDSYVPLNTIKKSYEHYGGEKKMIIFENSHHLPYVDEPLKFIDEVKKFFK